MVFDVFGDAVYLELVLVDDGFRVPKGYTVDLPRLQFFLKYWSLLDTHTNLELVRRDMLKQNNYEKSVKLTGLGIGSLACSRSTST